MKSPMPIGPLVHSALHKPPANAARTSSVGPWSVTPELAARHKIIGREYIKFFVALSIEPNDIDLDGKVALALHDWAGIPTNWLRRTCARARLEMEYMPKPAQILRAYRDLRTVRRKRVETLEKRRAAQRPAALESGWTEEQRLEFYREAYRNMGFDYDRELRRRAFEEEVRNKRVLRRKGG